MLCDPLGATAGGTADTAATTAAAMRVAATGAPVAPAVEGEAAATGEGEAAA